MKLLFELEENLKQKNQKSQHVKTLLWWAKNKDTVCTFNIPICLTKLLSQEKKIGTTEKQTGSCSQSTTAELHHNADPGCFVDYQILGSGRYSEESFTIRFCYGKSPKKRLPQSCLGGRTMVGPKRKILKNGVRICLENAILGLFLAG